MYHPREDLSIFNKKILLVLFLVYVVLTVLFAIMMVRMQAVFFGYES